MPVRTLEPSELEESFLKDSVDQWLKSKHCLDLYCSSRTSFIESNFNHSGKNRIVKAAISSSSHGNWLVGLKLLDWDSKHFNFKIARLAPFIFPDCDPEDKEAKFHATSILTELHETSKQLNIKHLSVLVHPGNSLALQILGQHGFQLMDTTVMYELDLKKTNYEFKTSECIREAHPGDLNRLQEIAIECFANRKNNINRFNSDPAFTRERVAALYADWIANSLGGNMADRLYVLDKDSQLQGFLSIQQSSKAIYGTSQDALQIPINAVSPEFKGKGIYRKLAEHAIAEAGLAGITRVEIKYGST